MDLKIDYAGLTDDDLRTVVAEATGEVFQDFSAFLLT